MKALRRPAPAFTLGCAMFVAAASAPSVIRGFGIARHLSGEVWFEQATVKTTLVGLALLGMLASGGSVSEWGFRRPAEAGRAQWWRGIRRGALVGAVAAMLVVVTPAKGMVWNSELGVLGLIGWIWLFSSVTEEIFVRGWFQGFVRPGLGEPSKVTLSGLLFGSMHLSILRQGADYLTVAIIVVATTVLGFLCAEDRQRSSSLGPAVATHIAFNIGGFVGGVVAVLVKFVATGQRPGL